MKKHAICEIFTKSLNRMVLYFFVFLAFLFGLGSDEPAGSPSSSFFVFRFLGAPFGFASVPLPGLEAAGAFDRKMVLARINIEFWESPLVKIS